MAFVNNKSNQNRVNTTTKVAQLYNPTGEDASTLTLGYWNSYVSLKINPALQGNARQDGKVYDYDTTASLLLNAEVTTTLYNALEIVEQEGVSVTVHAAQYAAKVGPASQYEGMAGSYYLAIFELAKGGAQSGGAFFVFDSRTSDDGYITINWDENTGTGESERYMESQWTMFKNFLKLASEELVSGGAHGALVQNNIAFNKLSNTVDLLKSLVEMIVGGNTGQASTGGFSNNSQTGGFGGTRRQARSFNSSASAGRPARGAMVSNDSQEQAPVAGNTSRANRNVAAAPATRQKPREVVMDDIADIESQLMSSETLIDLDDME